MFNTQNLFYVLTFLNKLLQSILKLSAPHRIIIGINTTVEIWEIYVTFLILPLLQKWVGPCLIRHIFIRMVKIIS
jgi:hypothetical protein